MKRNFFTTESVPGPWDVGVHAVIKNLFLSGVDAGMAGVIGAMLGGVLAGVAAEPVRALRLLAPALKRNLL